MLLNSLGLDSRLHGAMAGPGEYGVNGMVSDLGAQLGSGALCCSKSLQVPTLLASVISGDSYFDIVFFHHPPQTGLNWASPEYEIE